MEKRLKVVHVIGGGEFGGAEQHILSLMNHYDKRIIDATVVVFYDTVFAQRLREAKHRVLIIGGFGRFDLRIVTALVRQFQNIQPDIVHTHGVRANFFARIAAKRAYVPAIFTTVHSVLRHDYTKLIPYRIAHLLERYSQSITTHFIAVSTPIVEQLLAQGVHKDDITLIANGIDATPYVPTGAMADTATSLRDEWYIPHDRLIIGTIARLVPVKALDTLLDGFATALQQDAALHLLIVGDGPERERLQQYTRNIGIDSHVTFTGFRSDVAICLHMMDIYVNCSISEGTPVSVMEAMAAAKPLLLTAVGGMRAMAEDGVSALMIEPNDSDAIATGITRLKRDEQLRTSLATHAQQNVRAHYTIDVMTTQQVQLYFDVLKGK